MGIEEEIIKLRDQDKSYRQIALILGISLGKVQRVMNKPTLITREWLEIFKEAIVEGIKEGFEDARKKAKEYAKEGGE